MLFLTAFWIVVYCVHPDRCYVYKDVDQTKVLSFGAQDQCSSNVAATLHRNSQCVSVNSVFCFNNGSACTFDPADDHARELVGNMVPLPN